MSTRFTGAGAAAGAPALLIALLATGCFQIPTGPGREPERSFTPVWIRASFTPPMDRGGPSDRRNQEPNDFFGRLCPATSVLLDNWYSNPGNLTIKNNCTDTVTYYLCVSSGSDPQELPQCATDPLQTSPSRLKVKTLTTGPYGDWFRSTRLVTVHVFFCSDQTSLTGPPLKCR